MQKAAYLTRAPFCNCGTNLDLILRKFKNRAIAALGENLVCLLHHGSRAKGEAHPESDYDVIVIVKEIDESVLKAMQKLFERNPHFSSYVLSVRDLETMPKAHLLEFVYAKPLYGKFKVEPPTSEDVRQYLSFSRREELSMIRHFLLHPHPPERKAKYIYYGLKFVYVYLSFLVFIESAKLPPTRKETKAYFKQKRSSPLGVRLLQILDNWKVHRDKVAKDPDRYLFMLECFFRETYL